jgi:hypothetical protein
MIPAQDLYEAYRQEVKASYRLPQSYIDAWPMLSTDDKHFWKGVVDRLNVRDPRAQPLETPKPLPHTLVCANCGRFRAEHGTADTCPPYHRPGIRWEPILGSVERVS